MADREIRETREAEKSLYAKLRAGDLGSITLFELASAPQYLLNEIPSDALREAMNPVQEVLSSRRLPVETKIRGITVSVDEDYDYNAVRIVVEGESLWGGGTVDPEHEDFYNNEDYPRVRLVLDGYQAFMTPDYLDPEDEE